MISIHGLFAVYFHDMYYEFVVYGHKKEYRSAVILLYTLYEEYKEFGERMSEIRDWWFAPKKLKCNEGRMRIKRYLSLLANKKLRNKYLGF